MRYWKYIFIALFISILSVSCIEEIESPHIQENNELTLVPRVTSFANQYVTKAYESSETKITSLAVLAFDKDGNLVLIHEGYSDSGISSLALNKSMLNFSDQTLDEKLKKSTIVVFANINIADIKDSEGRSLKDIKDDKSVITLSAIDGFTCHFSEDKTVITNLGGESFKGFPMFGRSKSTVDLSKSSTQNNIEVGLEILYAKVNFRISVEEGTENQGSGMSFSLDKYYVHNVSKATVLTAPTGATASADYAYTSTSTATGNTAEVKATTSLEGAPVEFTFYVAESRYNHGNIEGIYPNNTWISSEAFNDQKQYYKPAVAEAAGGLPADGLATYVLLEGTYTDYRSKTWDVYYKVYLGKNNYNDFQVDRNSEYSNYITIRGIRNTSHHTTGDLWLDHRVDVSSNEPYGNISITRETLIDSHIEVRPLRISWEAGQYTGARVYLPTDSHGNLIDWIGIEKFTGENCTNHFTYVYKGNVSTGKRKYFTSSLISELQQNPSEFEITDGYIELNNNDCLWIYFDENVPVDNNTTTSDRPANIVLEFDTPDNTIKTETYTITQRGLQAVEGYNVESYEEYLHSYDSADKYDLTTSPFDYTQQGLAWGLEDIQLSQNSIVAASQLSLGLITYSAVISTMEAISFRPRYDYVHRKDITQSETYYRYTNNGSSWTEESFSPTAGIPNETGLTFTNRATSNGKITVVDLGTLPENAYQYCLSKNKFTENANGTITMDVHWYLPDAHEMQAILNSDDSANMPDDFNLNGRYWSSQPGMEDNRTFTIPLINRDLGVMQESTTSARVVSKSGITSASRSDKNRIRCLYSPTGISADLSDRIPDGVAGTMNFIMKGRHISDNGYFKYMLTDDNIVEDEDNEPLGAFTTPDLRYPTFANDKDEFGYFANVVDKDNASHEGFAKNPLASSNWEEHKFDFLGNKYSTGYFIKLAKYPGLSSNQLKKFEYISYFEEIAFDIPDWLGDIEAYIEKNLPKEEAYKPIEGTEVTETITGHYYLTESYEVALDESCELEPLDYSTGIDMYNISFSANANGAYPVYKYLNYTDRSYNTTQTRKWIAPKYEQKTYYTINEVYVEATETVAYRWSESEALERAKEAALKAAQDKANKEYPGYGQGTPTYPVQNYLGYAIINGGYRYEVTCRISIPDKSTTYTHTYYKDATDGGWTEPEEVTEWFSGVTNDDLRMYCGTSFTISLDDEYLDDYEITKVKVHYSGDNFVMEGNGTLGVDQLYARFIISDESVSLPSKYLTADEENTFLQSAGMSYSDNSSIGTGVHQWRGSGKPSVTLKLVDYFINNESNSSYTYKYADFNTTTLGDVKSDPDKYLIVDRIEVQCRRKDETASN